MEYNDRLSLALESLGGVVYVLKAVGRELARSTDTGRTEAIRMVRGVAQALHRLAEELDRKGA